MAAVLLCTVYIVHTFLTYPIRACIEARLLCATGVYAFDPFDFQASIRDVLVCKPGFYPRLYSIGNSYTASEDPWFES